MFSFKGWKGLSLALVMLMGIAFTISGTAASKVSAAASTKVINYNGAKYTVPIRTVKIVIVGSFEAMEDALVLNFKPLGAPQVGGKFPAIFSSITSGVTGIGEKTQPNFETILKLHPDIILSSTKFPEETNKKLAKIATTIPVSHVSSDWEDNLTLLANLTGIKAKATQAITQYKNSLADAKLKLSSKLKGKSAVALRIRTGNLFIYQQDLFFNPSLYADLGAPVPSIISKAKAQEEISLEKFAGTNPDYIFLQFSADENVDQPKALENLKKNPIWKSLKAVKNGNVFINLVDPLAQGGTAYSKINFLNALKKTKLYTGK
ncbi:ABC transporter substrate-binding protein [Paenibacillus sp. MMS18-CY102]|uniref:ABC transporter substrate-binding protein n=1 Tax=Paenibacillus sp. MMS18-CY102 TaxID=2682849 RepID=UPI001924CCC6|nr:ABC transporter substrate-binding protein [Paenibacillus sp. MMS18-CY102]